MMEPTDLWKPNGVAQFWRMDRAWFRRVFSQREMKVGLVIVGKVGTKDPPQMCFAHYDDMIEAFPAD